MDADCSGIWLFIIAACLMASGVLTLAETALLDSSKTSLERLEDDEVHGATDAIKIIDEPDDVLASIQIGLTFSALLTGIAAAFGLAPLFFSWLAGEPGSIAICFDGHPYRSGLGMFCFAAAFFIVLFASLVFGHFLPKNLALHEPEAVLCRYSRSLLLAAKMLSPLRKFLLAFAHAVLAVFGVSAQIDDAVTEDEVKDLIEQGTEDGTIKKTEQTMVERIFHLGDQTAYSLMTARTQIDWLDLADDAAENIAKIRSAKEDFFIVGRNSLDEFCGVLYAKDMLDAFLDDGDENKVPNIAALVKTPLLIPRSLEPFRVVEKFKSSGDEVGIVLDEYGGVIGFITYRDIIDEITAAEISEDETPETLRECGDHIWLMEGLCSIDDFKERFEIEKLPDEERDHYQTMGGFLTALFGYIPRVGEKIAWDEFSFEIVALDGYRIDKIRMKQTVEDKNIKEDEQ